MDNQDHEQLRTLTLAVEELRAAREEDRMMIEQLQITIATTTPGGRAASEGSTMYPDWISWVEEWLAVRISRRQQRIRWCRQYAKHPEVADRLESLWHAWEFQWPAAELRVAWFRDALDHQLAAITAEDGPLRECSAGEDVHSLAPTLQ